MKLPGSMRSEVYDVINEMRREIGRELTPNYIVLSLPRSCRDRGRPDPAREETLVQPVRHGQRCRLPPAARERKLRTPDQGVAAQIWVRQIDWEIKV